MVLSFFFKNHLDQVNPETKAKSWCGCVDNISCGDAVLVLFGGSITVFRTPPCLPQCTKSTKDIRFLFVPKLHLFKIFHVLLKVRDYQHTIT